MLSPARYPGSDGRASDARQTRRRRTARSRRSCGGNRVEHPLFGRARPWQDRTAAAPADPEAKVPIVQMRSAIGLVIGATVTDGAAVGAGERGVEAEQCGHGKSRSSAVSLLMDSSGTGPRSSSGARDRMQLVCARCVRTGNSHDAYARRTRNAPAGTSRHSGARPLEATRALLARRVSIQPTVLQKTRNASSASDVTRSSRGKLSSVVSSVSK